METDLSPSLALFPAPFADLPVAAWRLAAFINFYFFFFPEAPPTDVNRRGLIDNQPAQSRQPNATENSSKSPPIHAPTQQPSRALGGSTPLQAASLHSNRGGPAASPLHTSRHLEMSQPQAKLRTDHAPAQHPPSLPACSTPTHPGHRWSISDTLTLFFFNHRANSFHQAVFGSSVFQSLISVFKHLADTRHKAQELGHARGCGCSNCMPKPTHSFRSNSLYNLITSLCTAEKNYLC